jgi:hypothetical protein
MLINKFNDGKNRNFINLKSKDSENVIRNLTFVTSLSECGFWRICISNPINKGLKFYIEKGVNYTMSSFVNLELQLFINSKIDSLPSINPDLATIDDASLTLPPNWTIVTPKDGTTPYYYNSEEDYSQYEHPLKNLQSNAEDGCSQNFVNLGRTIGNRSRRYAGIPLTLLNETNFDITSITEITKYIYNKEYTNRHPIDSGNLKIFEALPLEEKKRKWPETNDISLISEVRHGNTIMNLEGTIYYIIINYERFQIRFYYMIYNCIITPPEDIHEYEQKPGERYHFPRKIVAKNCIVPIYAIPNTEQRINFSRVDCFGIYNHYYEILQDGHVLDMCKILDYIQRNSETEGQVCTTEYKFMGYYYQGIQFFREIKSLTWEYEDALAASISHEGETAVLKAGSRRKRKRKSKKGKSKKGKTKKRHSKK